MFQKWVTCQLITHPKVKSALWVQMSLVVISRILRGLKKHLIKKDGYYQEMLVKSMEMVPLEL